MTDSPVWFHCRVLAEAQCRRETAAGMAVDDARALAAGRRAGGDLEQRIITRALALPGTSELLARVRGMDRGLRAGLVIVTLVAAAAGVAAVGGVLEASGNVNILVALGTLVGLQTVMLLIWLGLAAWPGRSAGHGGLPGLALRGLMQRWSRRWNEPGRRYAALAWLHLQAGGRLGFWTLSGISHLFWLVFSLAALGALGGWLSVRQYDFTWGTTILDEATVVTVVDGLGRLPAVLGFAVPDAELIRGSRAGVTEPAGRDAWSGWIFGALAVYAVTPRLLLSLLALWRCLRLRASTRLDLARPAYARLAPGLMAPSESLAPAGPEPAGPAPVAPDEDVGVRDDGLIAWLGLELADWPPPGVRPDWVALGRADDRSQRAAVLAALESLPAAPDQVVVITDFARTPDRGSEGFLRRLAGATPAEVVVVLTGAAAYRRRGGEPATRLADWHAAAVRGQARGACAGDEPA